MSFINGIRACGRVLFAVSFLGAMAAVLPAAGQVAVTGAAAQVADLVGSPTMVTVVLKNGAEDPNLNVVEVGPNYVSFNAADGSHNVYLFSDIKELRVQGEKIEAAEQKLNITRALSASERSVLARAVDRTSEIFQGSQQDQATKMLAASLLVANKDLTATVLSLPGQDGVSSNEALKDTEAAHEYLKQMAASNEPATALMAGINLFLAGDSDSAKVAVQSGLASSSRQSRGMAANLAGLVKDTSATNTLMTMLRDRSADASAPAALALARLGNREIIPALLDMLTDINADKGDAAVLALSTLGGEDIVEQMKLMLKDTQNVSRFRIAMVLYKLRDPMGEQVLAREYLEVPSLSREAAMALAPRGNARGLEFLRARMDEKMDVTAENAKFRAHAAGALIEGGDRWAVSLIQEALRSGDPEVEIYACNVVSRTSSRSLLSAVQPAIESTEPVVAMAACRATFGIVNEEFRERWMQAMPNLAILSRKGTITGGAAGS